jgi:dTDP-4-amino-4,6-dideoxygalactose transaminase
VDVIPTEAPTVRGEQAVPFLDLLPAHAPLAASIVSSIAGLIESGAFINGPPVARFERAFAAYCGTSECVGVASGLDALRLALLAVGLERGEEVIVPAATFVATLEAVSQAGGVPVVVDVRADDCCLDPELAAEAIGSRTRALLPVHLYGQMADVSALGELAGRCGLVLVEDACQAHGARRDHRPAGTVGDAAAFSFYPGKNLGAAGDAGAVVTSHPELASRVRALREHGQIEKYVHAYEGWTARLDSIQALVLEHKLPLLDEWNRQRRDAAARYGELLAGVGDLVLPAVAAGSEPVWHLYVVRTAEPASLAAFLRARKIATGRHYPDPVHLTSAYAQLGYAAGDFPNAEALARECLSLPIFPGITQSQLETVAVAIRGYFDG